MNAKCIKCAQEQDRQPSLWQRRPLVSKQGLPVAAKQSRDDRKPTLIVYRSLRRKVCIDTPGGLAALAAKSQLRLSFLIYSAFVRPSKGPGSVKDASKTTAAVVARLASVSCISLPSFSLQPGLCHSAHWHSCSANKKASMFLLRKACPQALLLLLFSRPSTNCSFCGKSVSGSYRSDRASSSTWGQLKLPPRYSTVTPRFSYVHSVSISLSSLLRRSSLSVCICVCPPLPTSLLSPHRKMGLPFRL